MAVSVTCRNLRRSGNRVYITFTDKHQLEFESIEAARAYVAEMDDPDGLGPEMARRLFVRWLLYRDTTGTNAAAAAGKRLTFDLSGNTPIVVDQT